MGDYDTYDYLAFIESIERSAREDKRIIVTAKIDVEMAKAIAVKEALESLQGEIIIKRDIHATEYQLENEERELMEKIYPGFRQTAWDKMQVLNDTLSLLNSKLKELRGEKDK